MEARGQSRHLCPKGAEKTWFEMGICGRNWVFREGFAGIGYFFAFSLLHGLRI